MEHTETTDLPFSHLFLDLSTQLTAMRRQVAALERTTELAVTQADDVSPEMISSLQSFDYLHQSLGDLSLLAQLLALQDQGAKLSGMAVCNIIGQLQMTQTKSLLLAGSTDREPPLDAASGDTVLF